MNEEYFDSIVKRQRFKMIIFFVIGVVGIIAVLLLSMKYGSKSMSFQTVWDAVFHYDVRVQSHQIIHDVRLPRALAAILIGMFLALSGAVMQSLTMNPLAEPSLMGVTYGAAFALIVAVTSFPEITPFGSMIAAMVGSGATVAMIFFFVTISKGGMSHTKLVLAGVATGMFLSSFTSVIALYSNQSKTLYFWYAGSLANIGFPKVKILLIVGVISCIILLFIARTLTLFQLGENSAKGLGINVNATRVLGIIIILLLTGVSVSISGAIGFIGLVVPHFSRMLVSTNYQYSLPVTAVLGGLLLLTADLVSKVINPPFETPIGVVTAFIGVPFFLYLVRKSKGGQNVAD